MELALQGTTHTAQAQIAERTSVFLKTLHEHPELPADMAPAFSHADASGSSG